MAQSPSLSLGKAMGLQRVGIKFSKATKFFRSWGPVSKSRAADGPRDLGTFRNAKQM